MSEVLRTEPKYLRTGKSSGSIERIDRRGGYRSAGVIRGVSVITEGEALGHDLWIDADMLDQVSDAINARNKGIKSRFTHPSMSGDGLGKFTGRVMDASVQGDQVVADQHFSQAGHSTPDGDLAAWLMDMAQDDPDAYGLSIVFDIDADQMEAFIEENSQDGEWRSPDPDNVRNLPHARLSELRAIDAVDEPAANPSGLFHRESSIIEEAERLAGYALGFASEAPAVRQLGLDADRVKGFVSRYLETHNLRIEKMSEETKQHPAIEPETASEQAEPVVDQIQEEPEAEKVAEETQELEPVLASDRTQAADFLAAFGEQGAVWFAEGRSYADCQKLEVETLKAEVKDLRSKLSASLPMGEQEPIEFEAEESAPQKGGFASKITIK